ncbi:Flp pilus assembly protein CpaB [Pseudonocardia hierapolitana]|uniref:Flp pilus assembly protein CpaB n=1 Tax=Pseudonocardia hierapolitana TaxID=1128676 RepID=A0A561SP39_9PSEU|nr:SAF domain-containing protein [Pseudonocardia hierapolitana]TWF76632.1 Flp pilus assembly protein CpaB [Pseudonocardia hierapolitana]
MTDSRLAPRPLSRLGALVMGPGWRRIALLRRAAAGVLAAFALVLALAPGPDAGGVPVVVAAVDVAAGATLRPADLAVRRWPTELVPGGALPDPAVAEGRVLVGAARAGEPITDIRLAGPTAALGAPPGSAAVPVRLADAGAAGLLVPGGTVDVVTVGAESDEPVVLAAAAAVLAVLPPESPSSGRLVLVAMPSGVAARVAAASLTEQVAVTLR